MRNHLLCVLILAAGVGVWKALERCKAIMGDVCQIFVKNNMQWFGRAPQPRDLALYTKEVVASGVSCVFGHTGYLINLAAPPCENRDKSVASLIQELDFATALNLPFLVLHPGAHLGAGERAGLDQVIQESG